MRKEEKKHTNKRNDVLLLERAQMIGKWRIVLSIIADTDKLCNMIYSNNRSSFIFNHEAKTVGEISTSRADIKNMRMFNLLYCILNQFQAQSMDMRRWYCRMKSYWKSAILQNWGYYGKEIKSQTSYAYFCQFLSTKSFRSTWSISEAVSFWSIFFLS